MKQLTLSKREFRLNDTQAFMYIIKHELIACNLHPST
jgi:hypothetical protein